jgi:hypothetical protein
MGALFPAKTGVFAEQVRLARVEQFPPLASDWRLLDWRQVGASNYQITGKTGRCGYGFVMETFAYAWPLAAAVRYDNRLARGVEKWLLHAVDAARLFYPDQLPPPQQTDWEWAKKHATAIPYEGLMQRHPETGLPGPFAAGDPRLRGCAAGGLRICLFTAAHWWACSVPSCGPRMSNACCVSTPARRISTPALRCPPSCTTIRTRGPCG